MEQERVGAPLPRTVLSDVERRAPSPSSRHQLQPFATGSSSSSYSILDGALLAPDQPASRHSTDILNREGVRATVEGETRARRHRAD